MLSGRMTRGLLLLGVLIGVCTASRTAVQPDHGDAPLPVARPAETPAEAIEAYLIAADPVPSENSGGAGGDDLRAKSQNPIGNLISLPFQNNTSWPLGVDDGVQNVLNIQPVYPFALNADWNVILRTVLPVVYQPSPVPGIDSDFGLSDTTITTFVSPKEPGKIIWGVGPQLLVPTATGPTLGAGQWGLGVSGVLFAIRPPWTLGLLVSNTWSFEGDVNFFLVQPIVNYNLAGGWYVTTVPIVTADLTAPSDERWLVPVGGGVGRLSKIGKRPVDMQVQLFYNVESPSGARWTLRFQVKLLFPK
jgi:hypothetical protein